ncbi:MAG: hypothetical protein ABSA26_09045 [Thermoguttaceae bacterium]|jgi:hypothetical protein
MPGSLPLYEVSETQPKEPFIRRSISKKWIVLGSLVFAHTVLGRVCGFFIERDDPLGYLIFGFVLSQPILIAIWAALAPQRFYIRFLWGLLLFTMIFFAVGYGIVMKEPRNVCPIAIVELTLFTVTTVILLLVRRLSHWQITYSYRRLVRSDYQAYQFGIKHLIILTTVVALAFGLFRTLLLIDPLALFPVTADLAISVCAVIVGLFPIIVIPCFTLSNLKNKLSSIIYAIFILGIVDVAAFFIFKWLEPDPDQIKILLYVQFGASLSMFATTFVIRLCGFRMVRASASDSQISE